MKVQGLIYQDVCDLALPRVAGKGADLVQSPSGTLSLRVLFLLCQPQHTWKKTQVVATLLIPLCPAPRTAALGSCCGLPSSAALACWCLIYSLPASLVLLLLTPHSGNDTPRDIYSRCS